MPNSLACRLVASVTHNQISEIGIVVDGDLAKIVLETFGSYRDGEFPSELHEGLRVV